VIRGGTESAPVYGVFENLFESGGVIADAIRKH
jgi:hypothetical protein